MPKKKILASPSSIGKIDNLPFDLLAKSNYEVIKNPFGRKLTIEETIKLAKDCVGIVAGVETLNKYVIDSLPNLKCISRVGVGMDSVDIEYANSNGIKVLKIVSGKNRQVICSKIKKLELLGWEELEKLQPIYLNLWGILFLRMIYFLIIIGRKKIE